MFRLEFSLFFEKLASIQLEMLLTPIFEVSEKIGKAVMK